MAQDTPASIHPGRWWHALDDGRLQCDLCPRDCQLHEGQRGACFVRQSIQGQMVLTTYGRSSGFCIDPIEKKPLNHFYPGTAILSFGTAGCNLACKFCQNWDISKSRDMDRLMDAASPDAIAQAARRLGAPAVAFTYNDPVIFAEYAMDTAQACREAGIRSVAVTAGYIHAAPRREFFALMDAANVDLKSFSDAFYIKYCNGRLEPVKQTLKTMVELGLLVEVTTLVIPGLNDDPGELEQMASFIAGKLGPSTPWHLSRFHPAYQLTQIGSTPVETLETACDIALSAGLVHVYTGNVPGARENTYCPACGRTVVKRFGYTVENFLTQTNKCPGCAAPVFGIY